MTHELILTSVEQGQGSKDRGFCPVAEDEKISPRIVQHLFALNNSQHLVTESSESPVAYSHLILPGGIEHVLSRMAYAGTNYQQKPNTIVHHIVLDDRELVAESPAWLLALPGFHLSEWNEPPSRFVRGRPIPTLTNPQPLTRRQQIARQYRWLDPQAMALTGALTGSVDTESEAYLAAVHSNDEQILLVAPPTTPCPAWRELTGDAGWAGVLAETVLTEQPVIIIYHSGQSILPLFVEAMALLPPRAAWRTTFCTLFTGLPDDIHCQWKGVIAGSEMAKTLVRDLHNLVLDLTVSMGEAPPGKYVEFARHGQEHMLPFDAEYYITAFADADTKSFDKEDEEETKQTTKQTITFSQTLSHKPTEVTNTFPPAIQLPKRQPGLFELFLRRSSRFQFYFLYSIMFALMLFLLVLAVSNSGIFEKLRSGNQPLRSGVVPVQEQPFALQNGDGVIHAHVSPLDEPENDGQGNNNDIDVFRNIPIEMFEKSREEQKEPLFQVLEDFVYPEFLAINFPNVQDDGQFDLPATKTFGELQPLQPFAAALELQFIPLFELPMTKIATRLVTDALPDLIWQVEAIDSATHFDTPMFLFQWTEAGLTMNWHPKGLSNQHLADTMLSSLGFLQLSVADEPEPAIEISLFAPVVVMPVSISDLGVHAEYLPFASGIWQEVFEELNRLGTLRLEVWAEPEGDWAQITPASSLRFNIEVETEQKAGKPTDGGVTVFENVVIPFSAAASLERVVLKAEEYEERLLAERATLDSKREHLTRERDLLSQRAFEGGGGAREERDRLDAEWRALNLQLQEINNILERLPAAYAEIGQNETWRFRYSVFLESSDGKRKLLILTTE